MDFGGFFLFLFLTMGLLAGGVYLAALFGTSSPLRWRCLGVWLVGLATLLMLGAYMHQIYWLDEKLVIAAARGDTREVQMLLSKGASPGEHWEGGTTALEFAEDADYTEFVGILKRAGAKPNHQVFGK